MASFSAFKERIESPPSFMMIRLATKYRHGAINLLDKHEADHLMGKGHLREGNFLLRRLVDTG